MPPRVAEYYDVERWGYDPGTKIWTYVTGIIFAGIVDWITVIMPARDHPKQDPNMTGWTLALAVALLAPMSWLVSRILRKDWNTSVFWSVAVVGSLVFQLCVITWARAHH